MMRLLSRAMLVVFAICTGAAGAAHAATDPVATIDQFYAALVQTMKRGPQLGDRGRYDALAPAIREGFDLTDMARMAVGPSWAGLSPAQRRQVTEAFTRYTIATYASHFAKYNGEKLEVTGARKMPYGTIVDSAIVQPDGSKVDINYLMRQNGKDWQVADIYLQGTISQLADLRSQFSAVLSRGGSDALIETLNRKTASLVANSAAS